jgi:predicted ATPase/class 3 adenylate cyclase
MPRGSGAKEKRRKPVSFPTGTVAFLFSDIEGSSQRWESHRQNMDAALKQHDVLMRFAMEAHGGRVFKTVGDAFCVAFARVSDAAAASIDAQRALGAQSFSAVKGLRVRMGLHAGEASERNGDYFGPVVNRVARLMSIGHGGQVLVSAAAAELLQGTMPPQSRLHDLGQHMLRDLSHCEHVYQLVASGLPDSFPPLRSLDILPNNLPRQPTSFVGRDEELAELKALLAKSQVVTIMGTGGVGKTRAALQIGADLLDGSGDGVWFVDLARVSGPEYVVPEIASVFNLQPQQGRSPLDQMLLYLRRKRLLLILDNCEHVVAEASKVVVAILRDCAQVKVIATSREALNVHGEQVYRMPSLSVPLPNEQPCAEGAMRYSAVALFVARASAADAQFVFDDNKAASVISICRRLDGIALAIELAAARVIILNVNQLSQHLEDGFSLLTGGDRTALPRQQTMRATIEWSYELLSDEEKTLFCRLSIFHGGWMLEAAAAVCSDKTLDEFAILEKLSSLASKSLVVVEINAESQRYRLLESLRQYALEALQRRGEFDILARRHAEYFSQYGRQLGATYNSMPELVWHAQIEAELDNIRAALDWSLGQRNNPMLGAALAESLWVFWAGRNVREGKRWMEAAQSAVDLAANPALNVAIGLAMIRIMASVTSRKERVPATERVLTTARALGDEKLLARAILYHGEALVTQNRLDEAEPFLMEALEVARRVDDRLGTGDVLQTLGELYRKRDQLDRAREVLLQALQLYGATFMGRNRMLALFELAYVAKLNGDLARAIGLAGEAHNLSSLLGDRGVGAMVDNDLAHYHIDLAELDEARLYARSALKACFEERLSTWTPLAIETLGGIAARQGAWEQGARLIGYAAVAMGPTGLNRDAHEQKDLDVLTQPVRDHFSADQLKMLLAEGAAMTEDQAVEEALKV